MWPTMVFLICLISPIPPQASPAAPQPTSTTQTTASPPVPTHADILRGIYGPYRSNNDLLFYHLDVRVDPEKHFISGKNTVRFKMLRDGSRIQLDLNDALHIDRILFGETLLKYERDSGAVFVDFPETLRAGRTYSIDFYYSGNPLHTGRFGNITFGKDPSFHPSSYSKAGYRHINTMKCFTISTNAVPWIGCISKTSGCLEEVAWQVPRRIAGYRRSKPIPPIRPLDSLRKKRLP